MFFYVLRKAIVLTLTAEQILMLIRAVLPWPLLDGKGGAAAFLYYATELFVAPWRSLLERSDAIAGSPIDLSYLAAFAFVSIFRAIIGG